MKKIILGITAILLTITLSACGASSNEAAITNLGNQLDETANTITNFKTINPNDLSISSEKTNTFSNETISNSRQAQLLLLNEQYCKTDILRQTAKLKSGLSKNLKLSKAQITAIKDYTNSLGKYTNSIAYTESEMESAAKSVSSLKKNSAKNTEKINAKLSRLMCNSNARSAYFENILHTLEELENCLNLNFNQNENKTPPIIIDTPDNDQNSATDTQNQPQSQNKNKIKNIDTYAPYPINTDKTPNNKVNKNIKTQPSNFQEFGEDGEYYRYINPINTQIGQNDNQFNPPRNIDTYAPITRNIDTYGINNGIGYGINTPFGANRMYGGNGIYNGMYGNRFYGNGFCYNGFNQMNNPYGIYNSNNINRMTTPYQYPAITSANCNNNENCNFDTTVDTTQAQDQATNQEPEQRLEDYEILNEEDTIEKMDKSKQKIENITFTKTEPSETDKETKTISLAKIELHKTPETRIVDASKIQDQTNNAIEDELNKTIIAH